MSLKMRDLPRLTVAILFCRNKQIRVANAAVELISVLNKNTDSGSTDILSQVEAFKPALDDLRNAVEDLKNPKNNFTVYKVLIPKLNMKMRKLQNEGMYIQGLDYIEAEPQPMKDGKLMDGVEVEVEEVNGDPVTEGQVRVHTTRMVNDQLEKSMNVCAVSEEPLDDVKGEGC